MANGVIETAQSYVYTIITGIIILLVGFGLGILAKKLVQKILKEIELNRIMAKVGVMQNLEKLISSIVSYLIYLITIIFFLDQLGITSIVLYIVLGGFLMLLILTFLVGLKDVIPNFVAWLILQKRGNVKPGKRVEVKEISGIVEKAGYLETEIKTDYGDILYVPNTLFIKNKLKVKN